MTACAIARLHIRVLYRTANTQQTSWWRRLVGADLACILGLAEISWPRLEGGGRKERISVSLFSLSLHTDVPKTSSVPSKRLC